MLLKKKKMYKWPANRRKCSVSMIISEMKIRSTINCHMTPVTVAVIQEMAKQWKEENIFLLLRM